MNLLPNPEKPAVKISRNARRALSYFGQLLLAAILFTIYFFTDRKTIKISTSERRREYLVHVPPAYKADHPTPLVITIHGFAEWPAHVMRISRWNKLSDQAGFIVVYPGGTGFPKHWRVMKGHGLPDGSHSEVQFIADLVAHLEKTYNIDPKRIYANGFSNGGGMTHLLAEEYSEKIAAAGIVSGALVYPMKKEQTHRRVPLIAFHGTADPIVPFKGGPSRYFTVPFPSIPDWMVEYARQNGCSQAPVEINYSVHVTETRYADPIGHKDVVFYAIEEGGHAWPGGLAIQKFLVGSTTSEINATEQMWRFFEEHRLED